MASDTSPTPPRVLFFPGRGKTLKSYQCYFSKLHFTRDRLDPELKASCVILCHSRGIDAALAVDPPQPIVAMDPSVFDAQGRTDIIVFLNARRKDECPAFGTAILYRQDTHYPYMIATLRDTIQNLVGDKITRSL